jgi:hypothetical protein
MGKPWVAYSWLFELVVWLLPGTRFVATESMLKRLWQHRSATAGARPSPLGSRACTHCSMCIGHACYSPSLLSLPNPHRHHQTDWSVPLCHRADSTPFPRVAGLVCPDHNRRRSIFFGLAAKNVAFPRPSVHSWRSAVISRLSIEIPGSQLLQQSISLRPVVPAHHLTLLS